MRSIACFCLIAVTAWDCGGPGASSANTVPDASSGSVGSDTVPDASSGGADTAPDGGVDAGAPDDATPDGSVADAGPSDSGVPGPTLRYAATGAAGCSAFTPDLSSAPVVAPADGVAGCGAPFDADTRGRAVFGCMLDGGDWSVRLVDATGRVVTSFDADAGVNEAWAAAARDGIVGLYDPPDGFGMFAFAGPTLMTWTTGGVSVAYDFEGGVMVVKRPVSQQTWQRFDDLGNELTPEQPLPLAMTGGTDWVAIDVQGNVLGAWQPDGGAQVEAQWFGPDLAPLGSVFALGSSWPVVEPLAERGFALSAAADNPDLWTGILDPFASSAAPVPEFRLDRGNRAQWTAFSGKAYAFSDASCAVASWPCPTASAEIVAADGTSCGSLTIRNPDGSARPFILTRGGTIIDPELLPPRSYRWWPGVLR